MAVFKGVEFGITVGEKGIGLPDYSSDVSVRHVPGGNDSYIDLGGRTAPTMRWPIIVLQANYAAMLAAVGDVGQLTWAGRTFTAILIGLTGHTESPDGATRHFFDAEFVIAGG